MRCWIRVHDCTGIVKKNFISEKLRFRYSWLRRRIMGSHKHPYQTDNPRSGNGGEEHFLNGFRKIGLIEASFYELSGLSSGA